MSDKIKAVCENCDKLMSALGIAMEALEDIKGGYSVLVRDNIYKKSYPETERARLALKEIESILTVVAHD